MLLHYSLVCINDVLVKSNICLGNGTLSLPDVKITSDLGPDNSPCDATKFCKRVRNSMIFSVLRGHPTQELHNYLLVNCQKSTWCDSFGNEYLDVVMILKLTMDKCKPDSKIGVESLRRKIQNTTSAQCSHEMPKILSSIKQNVTAIENQNKNHNLFLEDTFSALLTASNPLFFKLFEIDKLN